MAKMTIQGIDEYAAKLSKLGSESKNIAKEAVIAGAIPVEKAMRRNLESNLSGSEYSTGSLIRSLGIADADEDKKGIINTKIGFNGYDPDTKPTKKYPRGTPEAVKARAMESGTSKQKKKPFIRPAVRATKDKSIEAMGEVVDKAIEKIMKRR